MRILIHGLNFLPELVGVGKYTGEMAEWLAEHGHDVRVVTAPPFNPASKVFPGFSAWRYTSEHHRFDRNVGSEESVRSSSPSLEKRLFSEMVNEASASRATILIPDVGFAGEGESAGSLSIFRCPVWVPLTSSGGKRILHLTSFALSSFWTMLRQLAWKPEVVFFIEPTLFCAPNAWITARLSRAKSWFHIQDFEADAAFDLGVLRSAHLRRLVLALESKCMRGFDRVSTISPKMGLRAAQKGVAGPRYVTFPNWVDTRTIFPLSNPSPFRSELRIPTNAIVSLYAGTMARKQGLEVLGDTVRQLNSRDKLHFVFCGDGPAKPMLADLASRFSNVHFLPLQPLERLNDLLNLADIHLLPQRADAADLVMPSKLTGMLASGRPVIAGAAKGTQLAQVVQDHGLVVPPDDPAAFTWAINHLASHPTLRERLGRSSRSYATSVLDRSVVLEQFEIELVKLISDDNP